MISKFRDKIFKQWQAYSHFASDFLAHLNIAE